MGSKEIGTGTFIVGLIIFLIGGISYRFKLIKSPAPAILGFTLMAGGGFITTL